MNLWFDCHGYEPLLGLSRIWNLWFDCQENKPVIWLSWIWICDWLSWIWICDLIVKKINLWFDWLRWCMMIEIYNKNMIHTIHVMIVVRIWQLPGTNRSWTRLWGLLMYNPLPLFFRVINHRMRVLLNINPFHWTRLKISVFTVKQCVSILNYFEFG